MKVNPAIFGTIIVCTLTSCAATQPPTENKNRQLEQSQWAAMQQQTVIPKKLTVIWPKQASLIGLWECAIDEKIINNSFFQLTLHINMSQTGEVSGHYTHVVTNTLIGQHAIQFNFNGEWLLSEDILKIKPYPKIDHEWLSSIPFEETFIFNDDYQRKWKLRHAKPQVNKVYQLEGHDLIMDIGMQLPVYCEKGA